MSFGLQEGEVFATRYRVIRHLAVGAMGAVYEVEHVATRRRHALKVMLPHILQRPELRKRFQFEAQVTAGVANEFIVEVFDAGIDEATRTPFLVMELLRGEDLGERLKRVGPLSQEEVLRYLRQTALALRDTHRASIIHRDLKPSNLFLAERPGHEPAIKVLDFGVATIVAKSTAAAGASVAVGTPHYMAPEQFRSGKVSAATDIYALGMIAYTLLTGVAYWADEKRESNNLLSFALIAHRGPGELASVRAGRQGMVLPAGFDAWFARATAAEPARRFAHAMRAVHALADVFGLPMTDTGQSLDDQESAHPSIVDPATDVPELRSHHTLRDYIGGRIVPVRRKIRWLTDLARELATAHHANRLCGRLAPETVIICLDGSLRVSGLESTRAGKRLPAASTDGTFTGTGAVGGWRCYVAPEQLQGQPVDAATDQFAWGVVAYELLTGRHPWTGDDSGEIRDQILHAPPPIRHEHARDLPDGMEHVVLRALEKRPEDRYPGLGDVAAALEPFADASDTDGDRNTDAATDAEIQATEDRAPHAPVARRGRLHRRRFVLTALALALPVVLGVVIVLGRPDSPLRTPGSVLACPILEASGVDEPAGWLGAAAAATMCERARVILGGSASRTRVPAELLDLPRQPVDAFPIDPYAGSAARQQSLAAARNRAAAYIDGQVMKEASGFRISLTLHRPDGRELARASGAGSALYQAVRAAMIPLVQSELLPRAAALDPAVADWSRARNVDDALVLLDVTLAMAQNAGGLAEECARCDAWTTDLQEMGADERWRCPYTLGLPPPPLPLYSTDAVTPAAYVSRVRVNRHVVRDHDREISVELHRLFEREPSALGRSLIAATESCALQSPDPERAYEMALRAIQADPKNPLGGFCAPWSQLVAVAQDTAGAESTVRAMQAWAPWDSSGWHMQPSDPGDAAKALAYSRRAYVLSPFDTLVTGALANRLLARGAREEVRHIALAMADGGHPVNRLESALLLVRVDASEARFARALERARRAMEPSSSDAGWVHAIRFDVAWRAVEIAAIVGQAAEIADLVIERFLDPASPPLDGNSFEVTARIPAICALASAAAGRRCFARFRALRTQLSGGILRETDALADGAERYAAGDLPGAAKAWRPVLREAGVLASVMPDAMAATFERTGDHELVERLEKAATARQNEFNGASPALVRAARRAAARGDPAEARILAQGVIRAWSSAHPMVPAVEEMRQLIARLP